MKFLRILLSTGVVAAGLVAFGATSQSVAGAATVPACVSSQIRVTLGVPEGAAGTIFYPIVFTNHGRTCALWGVPSVQPIGSRSIRSHVKVGPPARNDSMGEMPVHHVVSTAHSVSAGVGVAETGNYPPRSCIAKVAQAILVRLGTFVPGVELPLKISVCTKLANVSTRLIVSGVTGA